jgi:hypothetical protein
MNSFAVDWFVRMYGTGNLTPAIVNRTPLPRLNSTDPDFAPIVARAARLICTTHEFADLWNEVMKERALFAAVKASLTPSDPRISQTWTPECGVTDSAVRARLRAELDGLIAHLYDLTEDEFNHILSTFPLVSEPVIIAARNAYRDVSLGVIH